MHLKIMKQQNGSVILFTNLIPEEIINKQREQRAEEQYVKNINPQIIELGHYIRRSVLFRVDVLEGKLTEHQ